MDAITATQVNQASQANQSAGQNSATDALSSDFETFLLMMTTQLQNQDPLNPIESQDFAVQLATFSGVEQQVQTNELLRNLSSGFGAAGLSQLAGWVGMEARVEAPVAFSGAPVDIALNPDAGSDQAELVVFDSAGREVSRQEVPLGIETIEWVGTGQDGQPLPAGLYNLQLTSSAQGEVTSTKAVPHYAEISEARQGLDGIELVIDGGSVVASANVTALRKPDSE